MRLLTPCLAALTVIAACGPIPETTRGSVYQFNGETVTIRGDFSADGTPAKPTEAMIAQAKDVCPGATYLSATPTPDDVWTFLYLFKC